MEVPDPASQAHNNEIQPTSKIPHTNNRPRLSWPLDIREPPINQRRVQDYRPHREPCL